MKNTIKKLFQIIMLVSFILLSSCERDLYEETIKSNSSSIQMTDVSLSTLNTNVANKINQKISDLKREVNKNEAAKFEYDSSLNIYIDTENGKLIQLDGKLFYTFPMFRKSEEKLENIIFTPKNDEELEVYLAKYNVKPEEFTSYTNNENLEAVYEKFGAGQLCVDMVSTTIVYPNCPYPNGIHPTNNVRCPGETTVDVITICSNDGGGSGNAGGLGTMGGIGGIGTPGGNHQSGIGGSIKDIIMTVPIGLTQDQIKTKDFILGLSAEQSNWYFSQELQTTNNIVRYLAQNNFSAESVSFVNQAITNMTNNPSFTVDIFRSSKSPAFIDFSLVSGNTPEEVKFRQIYDSLTNSPNFRTLFNNLFGVTNFINVKFKIDNINPQSVSGNCLLQSNSLGELNNLITINRNNLLTNSDVNIAKTIIHECIHAFLNVKFRHPNIAMPINSINDMDIQTCINKYYNGFSGSQSQHDFFVNFLMPNFVTILNDIKEYIFTPQQIYEAENPSFANERIYGVTSTIPSSIDYNIVLPWNWNDFFYYQSFVGLHNCSEFNSIFPVGSQAYQNFMQYNSVGVLIFAP